MLRTIQTERRRAGVRPETFAACEAELRDYRRTKRRLEEISRDIAERGMGVAYDEEAHEQQASPEWSNPTEKRGTALATYDLAREMERTVLAIERVYERLQKDARKLVRLYYWEGWSRGRTITALGVSPRTWLRLRDGIVVALAAEMGRW